MASWLRNISGLRSETIEAFVQNELSGKDLLGEFDYIKPPFEIYRKNCTSIIIEGMVRNANLVQANRFRDIV